MTELSIDVQRFPGCHVVHLDGTLDRATRAPLARTFARLLRADRPRIVVDVTDLASCDSCGLSALITGQRQAEARGGALRLIGVHGPLARLLAATRLALRFPPRSPPAQPRGWPC
ncbi:MAG: STAS domain-containing protein [Nonomuraea sp.]|nr:STAS domain-containing protein [Nonomuraea sp.]NUP67381.1 STAS domain-containing protein [Nonomuraea sp.]NUP79372.1 STAS domain-containing protein [Nonomuraea sp.]